MDWLIALPLWIQLAVTLGILVPTAGVGASLLLWIIDTVIRLLTGRGGGRHEHD